MKRLLIQTQLSNYTSQGKFILECDSGWQMVMGRVREMLKLVPDLYIDVMGPWRDEDDMDRKGQVASHPFDINPDIWKIHGKHGDRRLGYVPHFIMPNALATRYDFDFTTIGDWKLGLKEHKDDPSLRYDAVYVNDPMHLRNFKAMFHILAGYQPRFYVHSHFIDDPSCPKFPTEASLWLGQVEAAIKANGNFWQCQSALDIFEREMRKMYLPEVVANVMVKSDPWDDGYSREEINSPIDLSNMRFAPEEFKAKVSDNIIMFFPNRISPSSGDYTNGMKFMFEVLPEMRKTRQDFVVIAGNPNLKFSNAELIEKCGPNGYVSLVPDTLNRDEFKFVAQNAHIGVGLYNKDTYGGTVARELVDLGCMPLWLDNYEYTSIARAANGYPYLAKPDLSDIAKMAGVLIGHCRLYGRSSPWVEHLRREVRQRCSYEATTPNALRKMGLFDG